MLNASKGPGVDLCRMSRSVYKDERKVMAELQLLMMQAGML